MGEASSCLAPEADIEDVDLDYFVDMITQLAARARALGEVEVSIYLDATAAARRHALGHHATRTHVSGSQVSGSHVSGRHIAGQKAGPTTNA